MILKRERAELREGLLGKVDKVVAHEQKQSEKVVTHEQKQVQKVVTHEQKEVEKIVKGSRRVDGVLWRHQSHVATRRPTCVSQTWQSNAILSCTNFVAPLTVDLRVKPGS